MIVSTPLDLYYITLAIYTGLVLMAFTLSLFYRVNATTYEQKETGTVSSLIGLFLLLYSVPAYVEPLPPEFLLRIIFQRIALLCVALTLVWVGVRRARREVDHQMRGNDR